MMNREMVTAEAAHLHYPINRNENIYKQLDPLVVELWHIASVSTRGKKAPRLEF